MNINLFVDDDYRFNYLMSLPKGIFNYKKDNTNYAVKLIEEINNEQTN